MRLKSKKGITLVESVIAVVVLAILASGVLTMLNVGGTKISQISRESESHAIATQQLDLAISAISNGSSTYLISRDDLLGNTLVELDVAALKTAIGLEADVVIDADPALHDASPGALATNSNLRGWYLELTYKGATVKGFASNTRGVFD